MPINKNALVRYRVINRCLAGGKVADMETLSEECKLVLDWEVSERTISGDIKNMKENEGLGYFAPIKYDRYRQGYVYTDPDYSIDTIPLNAEELDALAFSAVMLSQFSNVGIFASFQGAARKVMDAVKIQQLINTDTNLEFVQFEVVPYIKGSEFLQNIIDAIRNEIVLQVTYQSFYSDKPHQVLVHPYLLKEYRNRWYLVGLNDDLKELRTYALDRIQELKFKGTKYIKRKFDPKIYYKSTVGITTLTGEPPEIIFSVRLPQAQYLITLPLHEDQEIIKQDDEEVTFRVKAHPTRELINILLSQRDDLKILEPASLRDVFVELVKKTLERYE